MQRRQKKRGRRKKKAPVCAIGGADLAPPSWRTRLVSFGGGAHGQLGTSSAVTGASQTSPCWVSLEAAGGEYEERDPRTVHCAVSSSFGIMRDTGEVFAWGTGFLGFVPEGCVVPGPTKTRIPRHVTMPEPVETMACGPHHCLLICNTSITPSSVNSRSSNTASFRGGKAYSWGRGQDGVLGHGTDSDCAVPTEIPGLCGRAVVAVGCGARFSVALDTQGRLYTWGASTDGQLGRVTSHEHAPGLVSSTSMPRIASFACGRAHVLALAISGAVYSWGSASHGQTGHLRTLKEEAEEGKQEGSQPQSDNTVSAPRLVDVCSIGDLISEDPDADFPYPPAVSVISVAAGDDHSLCVTTSGVVLGWGSNEFGQIGVSRRHLRKSKSSAASGDISCIVRRPTAIAALPSVVSVSCGAHHSAAITDVGDAYLWGRNGAGQLGLGDTRNRRTPCPVEAVLEYRVTQVSLGHEHSGLTLSRREDTFKQTEALRETSLAAAKDARKVVSEVAERLASELASKRRAKLEKEAAAAREKEAQTQALARQREEQQRAERLAKERAQAELRKKLEKAALEKAARKRAQEAERKRKADELRERQERERKAREAAAAIQRAEDARDRARAKQEEDARELARQQADDRRRAEEVRNRARQQEREREREARRKEDERLAELRRSKELLEQARAEEEQRERAAKQKKLADREARRRAKALRLDEERKRAEELLTTKAEAARKKKEQDRRRAEATRKKRLETKRNEEARARARAAEEKRKQAQRAEWLKAQELKRKESLKAVTKKRIRDARRKAAEEAEREAALRAEREAAERAEMERHAREKADRSRAAREQIRKRKERRTLEANERRRLQEEADRIAEAAEASHRAKEAKRLELARRARQQREERDQKEFIQNVAKLIKAETTIEADKKQRRRAEAVAWMKKKKKENFGDHVVVSGGEKKMRPMSSLVGSLSLSPRLSPRAKGSSRSPRVMASARRMGHIDRGVLRPKSSPTRQRPAGVQRRK